LNILESALQNSNKDNKVKYGLSEKEAEKRYKKYGPNTLAEKKKISPFKILLRNSVTLWC